MRLTERQGRIQGHKLGPLSNRILAHVLDPPLLNKSLNTITHFKTDSV